MLQTNCIPNRAEHLLDSSSTPMALTVIPNSSAHRGLESKDSGTYSDSDGRMEEYFSELFYFKTFYTIWHRKYSFTLLCEQTPRD